MPPSRIEGFFSDYRFLSNFYPSRITFGDLTYPTVEHAYQAAKTEEPRTRKMISLAVTPGVAKKMGKTIAIRKDWQEIRVIIMHDLLVKKFAIESLRRDLLDTGNAELVEVNYWGDTFWGVCNGVGQNNLGKLLMQIRNRIKEIGIPD